MAKCRLLMNASALVQHRSFPLVTVSLELSEHLAAVMVMQLWNEIALDVWYAGDSVRLGTSRLMEQASHRLVPKR